MYNKTTIIVGITNFNPMSNNVDKTLLLINISLLNFNPQAAIKHKTSAFIGINTFAVIKSKKSKIVFWKIVRCFNKPKDNVAGIAIIEIIPNKIVDALTLEILNLSIKVATGTSKMLIPDVNAATRRNTKNAIKTRLP